jgi:hypothetical protein
VAGSAVQRLFTSTSGAAAGVAAARMCGIVDLSPATASSLASYAGGGSWTVDRAAGTLGLVLVSPEFSVN